MTSGSSERCERYRVLSFQQLQPRSTSRPERYIVWVIRCSSDGLTIRQGHATDPFHRGSGCLVHHVASREWAEVPSCSAHLPEASSLCNCSVKRMPIFPHQTPSALVSLFLPQLRSGFDFWRYRIFWEVVGLERGPLSLMSTIEELLERKSSGSSLQNRDYGNTGSIALTTRHPSIRKKLALTSPTSGGRSVGIVCSRT
jgi:hypothetical protein